MEKGKKEKKQTYELDGYITTVDGAWYICRDKTPHQHSAVCNWESISAYDVETHLHQLEETIAGK